jgi:hypothetical protein
MNKKKGEFFNYFNAMKRNKKEFRLIELEWHHHQSVDFVWEVLRCIHDLNKLQPGMTLAEFLAFLKEVWPASAEILKHVEDCEQKQRKPVDRDDLDSLEMPDLGDVKC